MAAQRDDPASILGLYRQLLALRRGSPALRKGRHHRLRAPEGCWVYRRQAQGEALIIAINFTQDALRPEAPSGELLLSTVPDRRSAPTGGRLELAPDQAMVVRL